MTREPKKTPVPFLRAIHKRILFVRHEQVGHPSANVWKQMLIEFDLADEPHRIARLPA